MSNLVNVSIKDRLIEPLAAQLGSASPAWITLPALLTGLTAAFLAAAGSVLPSLLVWILSRILDGLDGLVARRFNKQSDFGGYLDILCDFAVYAAIEKRLAQNFGSGLRL